VPHVRHRLFEECTIMTTTAPTTPGTPARSVRVGSPASLLAVVPSLLGFIPASSLVVIGTEPPRDRVKVTLRYDLPDPPDADLAADIAAHATAVAAAQRLTAVVAVGYGPGALVTPLMEVLRDAFRQAGTELREFLRVEDGRYWSYLCGDEACCPAGGTPFDTTGSPVAALTSEGRVLADRDELAATVAAVSGQAGESMRRATRRAEEHAARLAAQAASPEEPARRLIASGLDAVAEVIERYRRGDRPATSKEAAWLTVVLHDLRVRDDAWARMDPDHRDAHVRLWTDVTRLARPGHVPAPASLLAFVAWQSGSGALANVALDRALADDPQYSMALLLRQVISAGAPPSLARLPMTPEEVAASYDDSGDDNSRDDGREAQR
jgi:Domain of unknown function (DUF4192)